MRLRLAAAAMLALGQPVAASARQNVTPDAALALAPPAVRFAAEAADSILTTAGGGVSLEAFAGDSVTGVYLRGSYAGRAESVGYGIDRDGKRYLWFSIGRGDSLDYVAMLFDVDRDLTPEFLLFRTVDRGGRIESATEFRAPSVMGFDFDIAFQPACAPPRCDPASWTVEERRVVAVPALWFAPWRPLYGVAAARGERWLGRPVTALRAEAPPAP